MKWCGYCVVDHCVVQMWTSVRWERTIVTSTTAHVRIQTVDLHVYARQDTRTMASTVQVLSLLYTLCYMPCYIFGPQL